MNARGPRVAMWSSIVIAHLHRDARWPPNVDVLPGSSQISLIRNRTRRGIEFVGGRRKEDEVELCHKRKNPHP